jgi:hypothetical protein
MRRLRPQEEKRLDGFRRLRGVPEAVNFVRFTKYVDKLRHRFHSDLELRQVKIKSRRQHRAAKREAFAC